ncbi:cation diffusion facilitator family transporter [Ancylobacter amanitiformis]|uniref:Cation diffusion facilitator family transporter n=1 Tax=Ancylobacter amanitiformis TaxID=217069 RepID=A0ABU0LNW4_9HYPH|nr:cation diffusion facilitator family transporter [Ancylobacter amanitiformis]MDQ0510397.1 cation diffusion facilitator family transporter [Ancylobacter amanitiformis]
MGLSSRIALINVGVSIAVLGLKYVAYLLTGSIALYSDALESIVNVATSVAAVLALRVSAKPADANHPYGYAKAEYFSAVIVGVLIVVAAVSIFREVYLNWFEAHSFDAAPQGLMINAGAGIINAVWCVVLFRSGRRARSPALIADAQHLLTDVISSAGVLIGVALAMVSGWEKLDLILAGLVAVNILWSGWKVLKESVGGLMDQAVPSDTLGRIRTVIAAEATGAIEAHDLRTRQAGRMIFVDFHLVVPGEMAVSEAHAICDRIEDALEAEVADVLVNIHVEPEVKAKQLGIPVL